MGTIRKRGQTWRAEVRLRGAASSRTFSTRAAADAWVREQEREIRDGVFAEQKRTVAHALARYRTEVTPKKRGSRWEDYRLQLIAREAWTDRRLVDLRPSDIAEWRDRRLELVSSATVRRDMNLLAAVFGKARREWGWLARNPMEGVDKPADSKPRVRRVSWREAKRILRALGFPPGPGHITSSQEVGIAFLVALRTGMRAGEILGLKRSDVDAQRRVCRLQETKNGDDRYVPLSRHALRALGPILGRRGALFTITPAVRDALFRRAVQSAGIDGLRFHDTRREALSRLAKKFDVLELAKISGHRDPRILLSTYYSVSAAELARRLG